MESQPTICPNHMLVTSRKGEDPSGNWSHFVLYWCVATEQPLTWVGGAKPQCQYGNSCTPSFPQSTRGYKEREVQPLQKWDCGCFVPPCSSKTALPQRSLPSTLPVPRGTEGGIVEWRSRDPAPAASAQQKVISASGPAGSRPSPLLWGPCWYTIHLLQPEPSLVICSVSGRLSPSRGISQGKGETALSHCEQVWGALPTHWATFTSPGHHLWQADNIWCYLAQPHREAGRKNNESSAELLTRDSAGVDSTT